jgi:VCBS repeat-containing protein
MITVANGSLLDFETSTNHEIVVRSTDGAGSFVERTLTVNLTNANEGPIAVADTATAVEAGGIANASAGTNPTGNVLTNDTDVDAGDTKTVIGVAAGSVSSSAGSVSSVVNGSFGSITIAADGTYTYTVDNNNTTVQALRTTANTLTDVFTYTMRDAAGATSTTQITLTIQGANDAPSDITGTLTIAENSANTTSVGTLSRVDVDAGDGATYQLLDNAGGRFAINTTTGHVTVANGSLLNFEANTSHTIVVEVTDTAGATFSKLMTVMVTDVNDLAPINSTPTSYSATEDTAVALAGLSITDADGTPGTMTVTLSSATGSSLVATSGGSVTVSGSGTNALSLSGTVAEINAFLASGSRPTFTAAADFNGSTWITMLTSDNGGGTSGPVRTDRDVIAVTVAAAADATNDSVTTNEETPVTFAPLANDPYSGSRTITAINGTAITAGGSTVAVTGGNVGLDVSGQLTYTPDSNYAGNNTFTYTVQSTTSGVFTAGRLNYEFYNTSPSGNTVANIPLSGGLTGVATDFDVTALSNTLKGGTDNFAVRYTGVLNVTTAGTYQFWIGSDDGGAIFINGVQVVLRDGIVAFGESTATTTLAAGLHSIEIRYFEFTGQQALTADYSGPDTSAAKTSFFATPNIGTFGTVTTTETATISMSVTNINDAPTAVADTATAVEAGGTANATAGTNPTGNVLTNDTDIDAGDTRTVIGVAAGTVTSSGGSVSSVVNGSYGSVTIAADGSYTYTVDNNNATVQALRTASDTLEDVFTYTIEDSAGLTSTTQITITIQGANDATILDLDASSGGLGYSAVFTENDPAISVVNSDAALSDLGETDLTELRITVTGNLDGLNERLTVAGQAFTLNANQSFTNITVGGSSFEINYTASTLIQVDSHRSPQSRLSPFKASKMHSSQITSA